MPLVWEILALVVVLVLESNLSIKGIVTPEIGPKDYETSEKQGPVSRKSRNFSGASRVT